jgi:indole-3-glycerol phosphate synthase
MPTPVVDLRPLEAQDLKQLSGVLVTICHERLEDYRHISWPAEYRTNHLGDFAFSKALAADAKLSIIAEIKRSSPSKGAIAKLDPVEAALAYERGGARALSILTEERHFDGQLAFIPEVKQQVQLPILRKDFTIHPYQLIEALAAGASAILLMVSVLGNHTQAYLDYANQLGLDALVEVHDEAELDIALAAKARIIGVNNRDLLTLKIDLGNAPRLIQQAKKAGFEGLLVAESGYSQAAELRAIQGLADAVLIGSSIAGSGDLEQAVRQLLGGLDA